MRYALGIVAALFAGVAFNVGILVQKTAIDSAPRGRSLLQTVIREPRWILGFVLSFTVGTPLYIVSVGMIGPAIVPGLMSIGLVVLAGGAVVIYKERLKFTEILGIILIVLAVTAFGLSRLHIDVNAVPMTDDGLLKRSGIFVGVGATAALTSHFGARKLAARTKHHARFEPAAALFAAEAGLWHNLVNLSLGFITAGIARLTEGRIDGAELGISASAVLLTIGANVFSLFATQHALASGRASIAIPLQNGIAQFAPAFLFFFVYQPYTPSDLSFVCLAIAVLLVVSGAGLLTNRLTEAEQVQTELKTRLPAAGAERNDDPGDR